MILKKFGRDPKSSEKIMLQQNTKVWSGSDERE